VVDADDLIDELTSLAAKEIEAKGREDAVGDTLAVAEKIALGALHYYLLQPGPSGHDVRPRAVALLLGRYGPYIQYMGARASSIIRKHEAGEGNAAKGRASAELLASDGDWELVKLVAALPEALESRAAAMEPSIVAAYLHDLAVGFSAWVP